LSARFLQVPFKAKTPPFGTGVVPSQVLSNLKIKTFQLFFEDFFFVKIKIAENSIWRTFCKYFQDFLYVIVLTLFKNKKNVVNHANQNGG
jgi:hypothetical protein